MKNIKIKTSKDLKNLDRHFRANFVNSLIGSKQASLIGTVSDTSCTNLSLFSSVTHLGSNPPLVALFSRPATSEPKQTLNNIISTGFFTVNHVNSDILVRSHSCSFKFLENESEFNSCKLTEEYCNDILAPFVKESHASLGLKYLRHLPIQENGVVMIIGEILLIRYDKNFIQSNGEFDFESSNSVAVAGNNTYYSLNAIETLDYINTSQKKFLINAVQKEFKQNNGENT